MKWIKYKVLQNVIEDEEIFIDKKLGYSDANLAIAEEEAHDGYEIVEDETSFDKIPIDIEFGGTGANTKKEALKNLGAVALPQDVGGNSLKGDSGQFAVSDGQGGITWLTVVNGNEVAY